MLRGLLLVGLALVPNVLHGQPIVRYYLEAAGELSRGAPFQFIEETHEAVIQGSSVGPHRVVMRFNPQGHIVHQATTSRAGGITSETRWEYHDGHRLAHKHHRHFVNMIGWREEEVTITYNPHNHLPDRLDLSKNGRPFQWAVFIHDTVNHRVEAAKVFMANGAHVFTERLRYIETTNMVKVMVHRANEQFFGTWSYPWDPAKPFLHESVAREFYPNGLVRLKSMPNNPKINQAYYFEYQLDGQGNWIEKKTYQVTVGRNNSLRNKKHEHTITRTITYH